MNRSEKNALKIQALLARQKELISKDRLKKNAAERAFRLDLGTALDESIIRGEPQTFSSKEDLHKFVSERKKVLRRTKADVAPDPSDQNTRVQ